MNLVIDIGNTLVKLAVFIGDNLKEKETVKTAFFIEQVNAFKKKYPLIKKVIICSVGKLSAKKLKFIKTHFNLFQLTAETKLPFINLYETPKTLGVDRIALVCASVARFPFSNVLVIDAGTCITYDFINDKNEYLGGAISPGIDMRYNSLNNLTANLPLLKIKKPNNIVGTSTNSSIHSGVINGVLNEIDGFIKEYHFKYSDLTVILTGGNADFLSKQLKSSIFANSNFLLEGLNHILQFNLNE